MKPKHFMEKRTNKKKRTKRSHGTHLEIYNCCSCKHIRCEVIITGARVPSTDVNKECCSVLFTPYPCCPQYQQRNAMSTSISVHRPNIRAWRCVIMPDTTCRDSQVEPRTSALFCGRILLHRISSTGTLTLFPESDGNRVHHTTFAKFVNFVLRLSSHVFSKIRIIWTKMLDHRNR